MKLIFLFLLFAIYSCEVKVSTGNDEKKTATTAEKEKKSNKIRNGIILKENGLKVEEAHLINADGSIMSNENKIDINDKVRMKLVLSGWKAENDKVSVGAMERVLTSDGDTVLYEPDLFATLPENIDEKDAKYITLAVTISKMTKIVDHILVEFRVWDKKTNADVSGSYKLYFK
jgi:hypothetical protein